MSPSSPSTAALPTAPAEAAAEARKLADAASSREELEKILRDFDGCALKKTATNTVFSDGCPTAPVMVIGEAPGANEDEQGIPFCGMSGQLLDKMFACIGLTRKENLYISNTVFWRPPGNRKPSTQELEICKPFVEKHVSLIAPRLLVLMGATAATVILDSTVSIGRLRGTLHQYSNSYLNAPIPVLVSYHPSYLLRSPGQKRLAWQDMLRIQEFLEA